MLQIQGNQRTSWETSKIYDTTLPLIEIQIFLVCPEQSYFELRFRKSYFTIHSLSWLKAFLLIVLAQVVRVHLIFEVPTWNSDDLIGCFNSCPDNKLKSILRLKTSRNEINIWICAWVNHTGKDIDVTFDMWTPRLLWIPEHCMHMNIPKFTLAHRGPLQPNKNKRIRDNQWHVTLIIHENRTVPNYKMEYAQYLIQPLLFISHD